MTEPTTCPRCGAAIPPGSTPAGLCPRCLLQAGMESKGSAGDIVYTGQADSTRKPPPTREELAPHFPHLEIGELLGHGGMGAVYRANQKGLDRDVALKVLTVDAGADPTFADRFGREAKTLAKLAHSSIVHVYDVGRAGPWYYLVMELVEGVNLRQMLRAKTIGSREAMSIVAQMCDALQYAHDEGVVHRDIKPENVLVGRKGTVKILDFGLAKLLRRGGPDPLTKAEQVMGTPYYMAPEQWERPLEVDHRADIYSLGVVFYELLTGELPVGRFASPSKRVEIDVRLDEVVVKTLEKEPDLRYQHVSMVKTDIDRISASPPRLSHIGATAEAGAAAHRKRRIWPWIAAAAAVLLFLISIPFLLAFVLAGRAQTARAESQAAMMFERELVAQLDETRTRMFELDFRLDPDTAKTMGLDGSELLRVNESLEQASREYQVLEKLHSKLMKGSTEDELLVEVEPFNEELWTLYSELGERLNVALNDQELAGEVMQRMARKPPGPFGREKVLIRILREPDGGFQVFEARDGSQQPVFPRHSDDLPPEFQRFWEMAEMPPTK